MKHCILMLIHENKELVNKLLSLYPKEVDIYIHTNNIELDRENVINKIQCKWGDYSLVEATFELIKKAGDRYDYYHLTSGSCLPLCSIKELNTLEYPKCYIECTKICEGIFFGSQWWSLSKPVIQYILNNGIYPLNINLVPDECVFQTIVSINFPELIIKDNKRFIQMEGIHPRYLTKKDNLDGYLFARKVNLEYFNPI